MRINKNRIAISYSTKFAIYGRMLQHKDKPYRIELFFPLTFFNLHWAIYKGKTKPIIRNIYFLSFISIILHLITGIIGGLFTIVFVGVFGFWIEVLYRKVFFEPYERILGLFHFILAIFGLIKLIQIII